MKFVVTSLAVACLATQDSGRHMTIGDRLFLEEAFDVVALDGSFVPDRCYRVETGLPIDDQPFACVAFPAESEGVDGKDWDSEYVRLLHAEEGWSFIGGASIAYELERPISDECSQRLWMIGSLHGDPSELKKYQKGTAEPDWSKIPFGAFMFGLDDRLFCGDERHLRD